MKFSKFLIIFCLLVLIDILCFLFEPKLTYFTKPLIVGALLTHYIVEVPRQSYLYVTALIFEMLSQVFLAFSKNSTSLVLSKASSVVAILMLILLFKKAFEWSKKLSLKIISILLLIAMIFHLVIYKIQILENIRYIDYLLIFVAYALLIITLNLKYRGPKNAFVYGAILLVVAKLFNNPIASPLDLTPILLAFAIGHYLINFGLIDSYKKASSIKRSTSK